MTELSISLSSTSGCDCLERFDASSDRFRHHDIACAFCAHDDHADDRRAVEPGERARLRYRVGDLPQVVQPHLAAESAGRFASRRDRRGSWLPQGCGSPDRGRRSRRDRRRDRHCCREAGGSRRAGSVPTPCSRTGSSPTRISRSTLPMRSTSPTPRIALQLTDHDVLDEQRELLRRFSGSDRGIGENRQAGNVDAAEPWAR